MWALPRAATPMAIPLPTAWFAFLAESLSPLLKTLLRLENENIDAPLSLGLSPILCEMLSDLDLSPAYEKYLHRHIELCRAHEREFAARGQETFANLSLFWENWYQSAERDWEETFGRDPLDNAASLARRKSHRNFQRARDWRASALSAQRNRHRRPTFRGQPKTTKNISRAVRAASGCPSIGGGPAMARRRDWRN